MKAIALQHDEGMENLQRVEQQPSLTGAEVLVKVARRVSELT